jgi:rhodanese-related sulfurtransferase
MPLPEAFMSRRPFQTALVLAGVVAAAAARAHQAPPPPVPSPAPAQAAPAPPLDESKRVKPEDIRAILAKGDVVLLDVREAKELEELGTIEGAIHIPLGQLEARAGELPKDKTILTACQRGRRASQANTILEAKGFKTAGFCGLLDYKGPRVFPKAPTAKS